MQVHVPQVSSAAIEGYDDGALLALGGIRSQAGMRFLRAVGKLDFHPSGILELQPIVEGFPGREV